MKKTLYLLFIVISICDFLSAQDNSNTDLDLETELSHDLLQAVEDPSKNQYFADGWYEIGEKEASLKFDQIFLDACKETTCKQERIKAIINKWHKRKETKIALEIIKEFLARCNEKYDSSYCNHYFLDIFKEE